VTHDSLRYINILTYLLAYLLTFSDPQWSSVSVYCARGWYVFDRKAVLSISKIACYIART